MFKDRKGAVLVIVAVALVFIFGMTALVTDAGMAYAQHRRLSNALDAATLAGAQELPYSAANATAKAHEYLQLNGVDPADVQVIIPADNSSIELIGVEVVPLFFAKVIGHDTADVGANAKAIVGPLGSINNGIKPYAIDDNVDVPAYPGELGYTLGTDIVIKEGTEDIEDVSHGNFKAVALGGTGSSILLDNALNGYDGPIAIGDWLDTEPGNSVSVSNNIAKVINKLPDTWYKYDEPDEFEYDPEDLRVWIIPIVADWTPVGRDEVQVVAFGMIYVENIEVVGGKTEIHAKFIEGHISLDGIVDTSLPTTGPIGVNLVAN